MESCNKEREIIKTVELHPCLYDRSLDEYRDKDVKKQAWKQISETTGVSVNECKDIWMKVRNRLNVALRRRVQKPSVSKIKWQYEEELQFLVRHIGLTINDDQFHLAEFPRVQNQTNRKRKLTKVEPISPEPETEPEIDYPGSDIVQDEITDQQPFDINLPREDYEEDDRSNVVDDVDLFYLSVAAAVKKLPLSLQVRVRMKVCNLVSEAQLRYLEGQNANGKTT